MALKGSNSTLSKPLVRFQRAKDVKGTQNVLEDRVKGLTENSVPPGLIALWSGYIANIPAGWLLCDGTKGTPDLRDKFVVGARQDTGNVAQTNLTGALTTSGGSTTSGASSGHTHTIPNHQHQTDIGIYGTNMYYRCTGAAPNQVPFSGYTNPTVAQMYGTPLTNYSASAGAILGLTANDGGGGATSAETGHTHAGITPPYYALAFIMKA